MSRKQRPGLARTFAVPALIALASLAGLFVALLGDGVFDFASWLTLAMPVAAIAWAMVARRG
jgi:hypothetical protein